MSEVDTKVVTGASIKKLKEYLDQKFIQVAPITAEDLQTGKVTPIKSTTFEGNLNGTASGNVTPSELADALQKKPNPNLLDNPFFSVNQRGVPNFNTSNGYGVDRWVVGSNGSNVTINSDKTITITNARIDQRVEIDFFKNLERKQLTVSVLFSDGNIISQKFTMTTMVADSSWHEAVVYSSSPLYIQYGYYYGSGIYDLGYFGFGVDGGTRTIKAVKLEIGDTSTLAYDVPPNYATELQKCQRYYVVYNDVFGIVIANGSTEYGITLPVEMRIPPSVSVLSAQYYSNGWRNMNTESVYSTKNSIRLGYSSIPQYTVTAVTFNASADL